MLIRNKRFTVCIILIVLFLGVIATNIGNFANLQSVPYSSGANSQSPSPKFSMSSSESPVPNLSTAPDSQFQSPPSDPIDPVAQAEQDKSITELKDANNLTFQCQVFVERIDSKKGIYGLRVITPIEVQEVWVRVQSNSSENVFSLKMNNGFAIRQLDLPVTNQVNLPKAVVYSRSELVQQTSMCNNFK